MEGTLALWYDPIEREREQPSVELHVNLWRDLSADFNFLDIGFRLKSLANLRRFHLYFPVPVRIEHLRDLTDTLRYGDTLKAVFNDLVTAGTGDAYSYLTELDGAPHLTVHRFDPRTDVQFEPLAAMPLDGTIVTFGEELCSRMRDAGPGDHYLRLRVSLDGPSRDLFSSEVASGDWRLNTATGITEVTEFRFNERRSYPEDVARRASNRSFAIERIHYFLIRDLEHQLTSQHRQLRNIRRLEGALWTAYLQGEPRSSGTWRAPPSVMRRLTIYHWSASNKDGPIEAFTAFASFRAARAHLLLYAIAIVLLGALGSLLASFLIDRLRPSLSATQLQTDALAITVVGLAIAVFWLLVAAPWRLILARNAKALRRDSQRISDRLRAGGSRQT